MTGQPGMELSEREVMLLAVMLPEDPYAEVVKRSDTLGRAMSITAERVRQLASRFLTRLRADGAFTAGRGLRPASDGGAHGYHEGEPGYSPNALLHDGCAECAIRSAEHGGGLAHLTPQRFAYAWARAAQWQSGLGSCPDLARAEIPILEVLWAVQVQLERYGLPIGQFPVSWTQLIAKWPLEPPPLALRLHPPPPDAA